ncbi:MAG: rod shape-determining protein RodA [Candidatus Kerfeldbacteria bacterium]|nr:rod shape-determining protein RodA [Candidatus Kerfeldbacteria bacterium]
MWRRLVLVLRDWDWPLFIFTILLLLLGLAELYSSSFSRPEVKDLFYRQLVGAGLGLLLMIIASAIDYRVYRSWSRVIYLFILLLLVAVLLFGYTVRGTTSWLRFGILNFQPVEAVKFLLVIVLASFLSQAGPPLSINKTLRAVMILFLPIALVLWQPDFGAAFVLLAAGGALLISMPKSPRWWLIIGGAAVGLLLLGSFFMKDYQLARLNALVNPQADPLGSGYNVTQSVVAVGAGGLWGRGLGLGTQSQLKFLPEQHTDFIFASIAEELGLIGSYLMLGLWAAFFTRLVWLLRRVRDDFATLVIIGIFSIFAIQVTFNIGMNIGLLPVVGLTLPFVSFGSSSLVVSLAAVGLLFNLGRQYGKGAPREALPPIDRQGSSVII